MNMESWNFNLSNRLALGNIEQSVQNKHALPSTQTTPFIYLKSIFLKNSEKTNLTVVLNKLRNSFNINSKILSMFLIMDNYYIWSNPPN